MRAVASCSLLFAGLCNLTSAQQVRQEAEYYVVAYAQHYGVPVDFADAIVDQESGWQRCVVSSKGAVGLMQLMPETARRLGVQDRCSLVENVSGGVRYLAWLMRLFNGDLRLVAAAYYAGERTIQRHGLEYSNPSVVHYVGAIRSRVEGEKLEPMQSNILRAGEHDEKASSSCYLLHGQLRSCSRGRARQAAD